MNTLHLTMAAALALLLSACGGGSSAPATPPPTGAQPTPLTAVGKLTGFGSVYVNGVEFETDSASYDVDDMSGSSDSDVSVGMIVTITGSINADGSTGTADSVSYDDEIEGPVANLVQPDPLDETIKTFTVFGINIVASSSETVFEDEDDPAFGFDTMIDGDNVEVSGVYHGDTLLASYIEKQDAADDDFEVKGTVSAFDNVDQFTLTLDDGGTVAVTIDVGAEVPSVGVMDGQYVEVEGTVPDPIGAPDALLATKVELEDADHFDDSDDEVEIKGPLTHDVAADTWSVNGTMITFGDGTEYEPQSLADSIADGSADGLTVEVEGQYAGDSLHVAKIENEDHDLEFRAFAEMVNATDAKNGTITLSFGVPTTTIDVLIDGNTFYMDDDAVTPFDLRDLANGTRVEINARMNAAGAIVASKLEIEDSVGIKIEGPLDAIDAMSVTVLGVTFNTDPVLTLFPDGTPVVGDYVEIEDDNEDGTAETVEIED
jgi:hypothetical protein